MLKLISQVVIPAFGLGLFACGRTDQIINTSKIETKSAVGAPSAKTKCTAQSQYKDFITYYQVEFVKNTDKPGELFKTEQKGMHLKIFRKNLKNQDSIPVMLKDLALTSKKEMYKNTVVYEYSNSDFLVFVHPKNITLIEYPNFGDGIPTQGWPTPLTCPSLGFYPKPFIPNVDVNGVPVVTGWPD